MSEPADVTAVGVEQMLAQFADLLNIVGETEESAPINRAIELRLRERSEKPDLANHFRIELENIANAKPHEWEPDVRDQFQQWAQNRARNALLSARVAAPSPVCAEPGKRAILVIDDAPYNLPRCQPAAEPAKVCEACGGAGEIQQCDGPTGHMERCKSCNGTGKQPEPGAEGFTPFRALDYLRTDEDLALYVAEATKHVRSSLDDARRELGEMRTANDALQVVATSWQGRAFKAEAENARLRKPFDPVWLSMLYTAADAAAPVHRGAIRRAYEYIAALTGESK